MAPLGPRALRGDTGPVLAATVPGSRGRSLYFCAVNRLCERPGCSAPADVAYGFDADRLSVWLDALVTVQAMRHGVLCRRHADAMIVPLGWMLDDRREPTLRLFRAPATEIPRPQPRRERRPRDDTGEQLRLDAEIVAVFDRIDCPDEPAAAAIAAAVVAPAPAAEHAVGTEQDVVAAGPDDAHHGPSAPPVEPTWVPVFDTDDDLHGLLKPRGRLLSRAFNGAPLDPG